MSCKHTLPVKHGNTAENWISRTGTVLIHPHWCAGGPRHNQEQNKQAFNCFKSNFLQHMTKVPPRKTHSAAIKFKCCWNCYSVQLTNKAPTELSHTALIPFKILWQTQQVSVHTDVNDGKGFARFVLHFEPFVQLSNKIRLLSPKCDHLGFVFIKKERELGLSWSPGSYFR